MAPQAGLEPATLRLTAGCSAIELPRNAGGAPHGWRRRGRTNLSIVTEEVQGRKTTKADPEGPPIDSTAPDDVKIRAISAPA